MSQAEDLCLFWEVTNVVHSEQGLGARFKIITEVLWRLKSSDMLTLCLSLTEESDIS